MKTKPISETIKGPFPVDKIKKYAIMMFLAITPIFFYNYVGTMRDAQCMFFQLGGILVISCFFENQWLTFFMFLNVFLLALNGLQIGLNQVLNIFIGCLLFTITKNYFKKKPFMPFAKVLIWVAVANIALMIMQKFGIDPINCVADQNGNRVVGAIFNDPSGFFGIKMANGIFLSIVYPILSILNPFIALVLLVPILTSHASTALLAWYTSAMFYTWHMKRKLFLALAVIGVLGVGTYIFMDQKDDPLTFKSRFPMWHMVLKYALINPIGYGPDSFRNITTFKKFQFASDNTYRAAIVEINGNQALVRYCDPKLGITNEPWKGDKDKINMWDTPHNEYLKLFFEYGYFGIFLLIMILKEMFKRFKYANKSQELIMATSVLIVFAVSSLAHFPLELARLGCLFPIFLGVFYARTEN